ncbi:MAG: serine/threonine-protein kinase [Rhodothermales bacterium]
MPTQDDIDRYRRAQELFLDALDVPPAERAAWLDEACDSDELRAEVDSLLAAHTEPGLLDNDLHDAGLLPDGERPDPMLGRTVGPWRLEARLGVGGMGAVYRAVRDDGLYERAVAVKLLRPGADAQALGRRLRGERQILARLEHPHIARLYDGGMTDDGLPFLVLELVDGEELTAYVERRQPSVDERIALFLDVCDAVAYAHRNLVVHRDLKPSNILVTADGEVKLLDFGIARLVEADDADERTRTVGAFLTPAYAAPEQVRGEPVTTATDVYALGVVLYELLAGQRPYDLTGRSASEIERAVCLTLPTKPSATIRDAAYAGRAEPAARLRGDLDTIVLKALAKEPTVRYPSAEAFADDLQRHLGGLPVRARPATAGYRTRKFIQRHRTGVAAGALAVVALLVGLGMAVWQGRVASTEAAKAETVNAFLLDMLASPDPYADGREVRVVDVLDRTRDRVEGQFEGQPAVEAAVRHTLGVTYHELGLYDEAEAHFRRALALRERLHGPRHADVAETQGRLARTLQRRGEHVPADSLFRLALGTDRALFGDEHTRVAGRLSDMGTVLWEQGDYDAAEPYLRDALALEERLRGPAHDEVATNLGNLATLLSDRGDNEEAERLYRRELAILRANHGDDHPGIPQALSHIAIIRDDLEDHAEAEALHTEALALFRRLKGDDHPDVGYAMNNLASVKANLGDLDAAVALQSEAAALYEAALGPDHPNLGIQYNNIASVQRQQGDIAGAEAAYRRAVEIWQAGLSPDHPYLGYGLSNLGAVLLAQDRPREALPLLREAHAIRVALLPPDNPERANTASILGAALSDLGDVAEAESLLVASYEVLHEALGAGHTMTARAAERLADFFRTQGRPGEAARLEESGG